MERIDGIPTTLLCAVNVDLLRNLNSAFLAAGRMSLLAFSLTALSCKDAPVPRSFADDSCRRPSGSGQGRTSTLTAPDPLPCRLQFVTTGTRLLPTEDGSHPDPGRSVVRDQRGLFYTANAAGFPGVVAVWDSTGGFLRTIGRPGGGPGEFSPRGSLFMMVDRSDQLHVRDGNSGWSVFAPDHSFLRRSLRPQRVFPDFTVMLDDGRIVSGLRNPRTPDSFFTVFSPADDVVRSFGTNDLRGRSDRPLAAAEGDQFWAGPSPGDPRGYVLELWNAEGKLLRSWRRDVPWFAPRDEEVLSSSDGPPPPAVGMIHFDKASELLLVFVGVPSDRWREAEEILRDNPQMDDDEVLYDGIVEVIDTRTGLVLASEKMSVSEVLSVIRNMFPGIRQGYRIVEQPSGLPVVEMMTYILLPAQ